MYKEFVSELGTLWSMEVCYQWTAGVMGDSPVTNFEFDEV